jgi:curved DNA-binding protein CbpA
MSLYEDLGVTPDATPEQIEQAGRNAAKRHHPDAGGDPETFSRSRRALAVLRDPHKRARYDETGQADDAPSNEQAELAGIIVPAFMAALQQLGPMVERADVVKEATAQIVGQINHQRAERGKALEAARLFKRALKRLSFTGDGPDLIAEALRQNMEMAERAAAAMDQRQGVLFRARDHLALYGWEMPVAEEAAAFAFVRNGGTARSTWSY